MLSINTSSFRIVLFLIIIIGQGFWSYSKIETVRESYQSQKLEKIKCVTKNPFRKATAAEITKQGNVFMNWSVLILGGIVALLSTTKVQRSSLAKLFYILLGPSAVFLVGSLYTGWILKKRYAYLTIKNNFSSISCLNKLLNLQADLFFYALAFVSFFALFAFILILSENNKCD